MKYRIDKQKRPVYLQIYRQIRDDITSGTFEFNSKLPSKRLLADEVGVSTITVEHAYALLCDEGYILLFSVRMTALPRFLIYPSRSKLI